MKAEFFVGQEAFRGFLEPGELILEPILEEHFCTGSEKSLLVEIHRERNGSQGDQAESEPPGVGLVGQVFLYFVCCCYVSLEALKHLKIHLWL